MNEIVFMILLFVLCFLLGSIPFGLIISRVFYGEDIRKSGSGNIGTTNTMRVLGKKAGIATFVLDFGKGLLSGALAKFVAPALFVSLGAVMSVSADYSALCSHFLVVSFIACVSGHIFSPWLSFKGGKGIAVAVGCLFFTFGVVGALIELALFAVLVLVSRYVSLGSVAAAVLAIVLGFYYYSGDWISIVFVSITALLVIWAHRGNISRLLKGTERKVGSSKKSEAE